MNYELNLCFGNKKIQTSWKFIIGYNRGFTVLSALVSCPPVLAFLRVNLEVVSPLVQTRKRPLFVHFVATQIVVVRKEREREINKKTEMEK